VTQSVFRSLAASHRRCLAALTLGVLLAAGCAVFRREPLDVPPGHRLVLGGVDIARFGDSHVVLEIVRVDGGYSYGLPVDVPRTSFVITLPPGKYNVLRLRLGDSGRTFPNQTIFPLQVGFEVGDAPAVYVGTLQIERVAFARFVRTVVQDDHDRTVSEIRARHPELPAVVVRSLMQPG
jgi:hypothetical protein